MATRSDLEFTLGVVNADGTNRDETLNTPEKLANGLVKLYDTNWKEKQNFIFTVSEFQGKAKNQLHKLLERRDIDVNSYGDRFQTRDYIAAYWDETNWKPKYKDGKFDLIWSHVGKYAGLVLWDQREEQQVVHLSVHMPKRRSRPTNPAKAYDLLEQFVQDHGQDYPDSNGFIIAGDYNKDPEFLAQKFSSLNLGIREEDGATTKAGNSLDNVLSSDGIKPIDREIHRESIALTHHPLTVKLQMED